VQRIPGLRLATLALAALVLAGCAVTRPAPPDAELRRMAGQMLLVGFRGAGAVDERDRPLPILRQISELGLGGVILFDRDAQTGQTGRNIISPRQLRRLTAMLAATAREAGLPPLFLAVDQEGGRVQRLRPENGFPGSPPAAALCPSGDGAPALAIGAAVGYVLRQSGLNLDFAPVCDVNVNPANPAIGALGRSFSSDPAAAAACAAGFAKGLKGQGVLTAAKHFPGHGSSTTDSHLGVTDISATWSEAELKPFAALIDQHLADMVMTAHVFNRRLDAEHPATLSKAVITGLLRERLGFDGVVVTDDLQMRAIAARYGLKDTLRLAVLAGADVLLIGNNLNYDEEIAAKALDALMELVAEGAVPAERIRQSYARIMRLKAALPAPR
jgi:beta-N-acetylhexosaminidase